MSIWNAFSTGATGFATSQKRGGFFSDVTAGGVLSTIGSIFGTTKPPAKVYPRSTQPVVKKANTNMLLIVGGAVLVVVVLFVFLKK